MSFTESYVQTTASNLNAGSTTDDVAPFTYVSKVAVNGWNQATGVFTVASGNPSSDGVTVGMFASVYVTAGATVATFIGRITARDTTTITVSLTAVSGSPPATDALGATTMKVGGAWKGPNAAVSFPFGFVNATMTNAAADVPRINFKSGVTYSITTAMTHNVGAGGVRFQGYTTTIADGGMVTIDGGTSGVSYTLLTLTGSGGANIDLIGFIFQNNGATSNADGVSIASNECSIANCVFNNFLGNGIVFSGTFHNVIRCEAYACNKSNTSNLSGFAFSNGSQSSFCHRCISHDNTTANANGFRSAVMVVFVNCISDSNGNNGYLLAATTLNTIMNCDAYNNTSDGININGASAANNYITNCNLVKNGGWGINASAGATVKNGFIINCGFGSGTQVNTSGQISTISPITTSGSVTYSSNLTPWVDPANGDFRISLNAAWGTGIGHYTQTAASYTGTVAYPDIGAAQHPNPTLASTFS